MLPSYKSIERGRKIFSGLDFKVYLIEVDLYIFCHWKGLQKKQEYQIICLKFDLRKKVKLL